MLSMKHEFGRPIVINDHGKRLLSRSAQKELLDHLSAHSAGAASTHPFPQNEADNEDELRSYHSSSSAKEDEDTDDEHYVPSRRRIDWSDRDVEKCGYSRLYKRALSGKLNKLRFAVTAEPDTPARGDV